jgi:hypothetical protein
MSMKFLFCFQKSEQNGFDMTGCMPLLLLTHNLKWQKMFKILHIHRFTPFSMPQVPLDKRTNCQALFRAILFILQLFHLSENINHRHLKLTANIRY